MAKETIGIGIDLGTTTCEAFVYHDKQIEHIKFERIT